MNDSRAHIVREDIGSSDLNDAQASVSEIGEDGELKTRSGWLLEIQISSLGLLHDDYLVFLEYIWRRRR